MTDLQSLLSRVEKATGPDRELDEQLAMRLAGFKATITVGHEALGNLRTVPAHAPHYSASLDAALALVEGALGIKGTFWRLRLVYPVSDNCANAYVVIWPYPKWVAAYGEAPTPALALLAALLRALIAQEIAK